MNQMRTWLQDNLFRTVKDSFITVLVSAIAGLFLFFVGRFVFFDSDWEINRVNLRLLMLGRYPQESEWLLVLFLGTCAVCIAMVAGLVEGAAIKNLKRKPEPFFRTMVGYLKRFWILGLVIVLLLLWAGTWPPFFVAVAIVAVSLVGKALGLVVLARVPESMRTYTYAIIMVAPLVALYFVFRPLDKVDDLGGFFLNTVVAVGSIALCLPIGILLALGRRSKMRAVSVVSATYIELVRGAPLYVLLLLAGTLVEFVLPGTFSPPNILRAVIVFTIFTAAYMAEIVRGGLQSLPKGQQEAAQALGLSPYKQTTLIILPQALRNVIPAQVGQLISLFKDTTLAGIALSLFDVLTISQSITKQDAFKADSRLFEALLFSALLFWSVAYTVSKESQRFEKKLGVGV